MRYYLDTNVLASIFLKNTYKLTREVQNMLEDYGNLFYASSVAVQELIHLIQVERIKINKAERIKASDVMKWLDTCGVTIVYVNGRHLQAYSEMPIVAGHTDPSDRLIIAQAITDRVPLVSSDLRFPSYADIGLEHIPSK